ncbi:MAG: AAA family ATPase, partial [Candidatus Heimdallarchaeaceae archaeon]
GVNIIKGRSHSGKSSIIRALRWALQNRPSGFHFKSHFSDKKDETRVSVEFENDDFISRVRNNAFNGYNLGTESPLEALRTDIPDEVKAITQMNNINLQSQGDKYFMLQETPGTVAKELNNIVGLNIIDDVNKKVSSIINSATSKYKGLSIEIKEKKEEIKKYKHLKKAEKLIKKIDTIVASVALLQDKINGLISISTELEKIQEEMGDIIEWLTVEKPFKEIKKKQLKLIELQSKAIEVSTWVNEYKKTEILSLKYNRFLSLEKPMKQAKSILNKLSEMRFKHNKILKLYTDVQNTEKSLNLTSDLLKIKIKEKTQLLNSHKNEFCVKCGAHKQFWRKK